MRTIVLPLMFAANFLLLPAQEVKKYSGGDAPLGARWSWALEEAASSGNSKDFWVGYSMKRLMNEDSYIMSGNTFNGSVSTRTTLYDILGLPKPEGVKENSGYRTNEGTSIFRRMKDIALLFHYLPSSSGNPSVQKVEICTMELSIDLKKAPVFWIGIADDEQSVQQLTAVYKTTSSSDTKKRLVEAIGIHQQSSNVYPFLVAVLTGQDPDDVRSNAAFWLNGQHNPAALTLLMDVVQKDRSLKVREQAVFAISQINDESSTDALITLVRKSDDTKVRSKAAFWLGQKASQKAVATLEDVIASDEETDVQRQALYGLAQMKDKEGVERLIKIAKTHPNPRIRKQAIQILGQSEDPKALEALIEIARK